jgi:hypothetical protein
MASTSAPVIRLSPQGKRMVMWVLWISAGLGILLGIEVMVLHLTMDPFADVRIYYDAGARLNAGQPLYGVGSDDGVGWYVYPPLVAILFRPLALLPFPVAAAIWEAVIIAALVFAIRRAGFSRRTGLVVAWLALPIGWSLAVGQAEPVVTALLAFGSPASVALAGHIKIVPWAVAVYWLGRGDWRSLGRFALWAAIIGVVQLVLAPDATLAMLRGEWLAPAFNTRNISLFSLSPVLWAIIAGGALVVALRLARGRMGWSVAVVVAVVTNPRLLVYQLMTLLAALSGPQSPGEPTSEAPR